jgi:hypothetical protein
VGIAFYKYTYLQSEYANNACISVNNVGIGVDPIRLTETPNCEKVRGSPLVMGE